MGIKKFFPILWVRPWGHEFLATCGLKLDALLPANIVQADLVGADMEENQTTDRSRQLNPLHQELWHNSCRLIRNLSAWPPETFVELHWTSQPHLESPAHGKLDITITLNCLAEKEEQAKKEVLSRYLPFNALLLSHHREAIFAPIQELDTLKARIEPFEPRHCLALVRRRKPLNLRLNLPLTASAIGFLEPPLAKGPERDKDACLDHLFPWLPAFDPLHRLADFLLWYPEPIWVKIRLRPHPLPQEEDTILFDTVKKCEKLLKGTVKAHETILENQAVALQDFSLQRMLELAQGKVGLAAFLAARHFLDESLVQMVAGSFFGYAPAQEKSAVLQGGTDFQAVTPQQLRDPQFHPDNRAFCITEAASLFRLPWPPQAELHGIPLRRWRTAFADLPPANPDAQDHVTLGLNIHRGVSQSVQVNLDDLLRHVFVAGQTGTGKSTLLENLILQNIQDGHGLCLIDPHGELVETILHKFPEERQQDLVLIDLTDTDYPFALNLLAYNTPDERDFLIDGLFQTVDRLYDLRQTGGPIFEKYWRGGFGLLLGIDKQVFIPTILELPLVFTDRGFRRFCLEKVEDKTVHHFVEEIEDVDGEAKLANMAPYITSKLSRFTQDQRLRRIFGQSGLSLDFSQIMDRGQVVLVNLGKGVFGPTVSALVASQLVGRFQGAAMARAHVPPAKRREFFLYVDECHTVVNESFAELLAEARKYKLGLILCTQYTDQLRKSWVGRQDTLLEAILGNVGMIFSFRLGLNDAERLAGAFVPSFSAYDLLNLPNWEAYVKLSLGGRNIPAFNLQTLPPPPEHDPDKVARLRDFSRKRYCRSAAEVEAEIQERWRKLEERDYKFNSEVMSYFETNPSIENM